MRNEDNYKEIDLIEQKVRFWDQRQDGITWVKNSKYFLNLEKRHYNKGTINCLKTDGGESLASDKEILKEHECFYRDLYKSNLNTEAITEQEPCFNKVRRYRKRVKWRPDKHDRMFRIYSIKSMEGNKTPGTDRLPVEFYKVFWKDVGELLVNSLNYAYASGVNNAKTDEG